MLILTKENLVAYLKTHYPALDLSGPVTVTAIGDPDDESTDVGLVNYIYRVKTPQRSVIVKQARSNLRMGGPHVLPTDRNLLEYESIRLRGPLVPQYLPELYYLDRENHVFLMEDISYLPSGHSQICAGVMLPDFGRRCAEFVAATTFYHSEFYLETEQFRALASTFTNSAMRNIMETWLFLRIHSFPPNPMTCGLDQHINGDPDVVAACCLLRHKFMTQNEALIHGDLHTFNIFADDTRMKVIDMEYTFAGPICYDIGYLTNCFVAQYCAALFRPFPSRAARAEFLAYLLGTIRTIYNHFVACFQQHWAQDAKPLYQERAGLCQLITDGFLPDVVGFAAVPGVCRTLADPGYTEFDLIPDPEQRRTGLQLLLVMTRHLLLTRHQYTSIEAVTSEMERIAAQFL